MMKLVFLAIIIVVWIQLAQAEANPSRRTVSRSGRSSLRTCKTCYRGGRYKCQRAKCSSCSYSRAISYGYSHIGDYIGYFYGNEETCLDNVVVSSIPSVLNTGCYTDANFNNLPFIHPQWPAMCVYTSTDGNCTRPGYQNVAVFDWLDIYFLRHPKEDMRGVHAVIAQALEVDKLCIRKPFACFVGTRFGDLSMFNGFDLHCFSYTAHGACPRGAVLANSTSFLSRGTADQAVMVSSAISFMNGGKSLNNLCVQDFEKETQGIF